MRTTNAKVDEVKKNVSKLKANMSKLQADMDVVKEDLSQLRERRRNKRRGCAEKCYGTKFAESYTVLSLQGLNRLVTETDVL